MDGVQSLFGPILLAVVAISVVIAVVAVAHSGRHWDSFGRDRLTLDDQADDAAIPPPASEREEEIRELLQARNERRRGEPALEVEDELRRLTAPQTPEVDEELRAEIRALVVARNHRRVRAGKPPLDVEAEIAREIAELSEPR